MDKEETIAEDTIRIIADEFIPEDRLSTGNNIIDELLQKGYERDIITTIYGPASTGKTTLCLLASISAVRQGRKVIFIDTEGGLSLTRFNQLCDDNSLLRNIFLLKPTSFQEQDKIISRLNNMVNEHIGLIIVDTIGMLYRVEYGKKQNIKEVNNRLSQQINFLTEIARKHKIPILLTNQVYSDFDVKDAVKIVGGDLINYASKCMIELKKAKGSVRGAILKKHRSLPEKETTFKIVDKGFERV
ncbi:MAG: DNA repair and recombination protein RadB [Candidatus Woesearchaeota archaeon]